MTIYSKGYVIQIWTSHAAKQRAPLRTASARPAAHGIARRAYIRLRQSTGAFST